MKKRILSLMLLVIIFILTLSQAFGEISYNFISDGFIIDVKAPDEAKVDEDFNVKLTIYPNGNIYVKSLTIAFNSLGVVYKETLLYQQDMDKEFSKTFSFIPTANGRISCSLDIYYVTGKGTSYEENHYESFSFDLTEVVSRTRGELEEAYWNYSQLKQDYKSLRESYDNLEEAYNTLSAKLEEQRSYTSILLLLLIFSVVLLALMGYFLWKKL